MDRVLRSLRNPRGVEEQAAYERARCRTNQHELKVYRCQKIKTELTGAEFDKNLKPVFQELTTIQAWEEFRCEFCGGLAEQTEVAERVTEHPLRDMWLSLDRDEIPDDVWEEIKTWLYFESESSIKTTHYPWYDASRDVVDWFNAKIKSSKLMRDRFNNDELSASRGMSITHPELNGAILINPGLAILGVKCTNG